MKISVITPSFNQGHLIEKTIKSVVQQGHSDLEYIVMDGKSSDNTLEVLKMYEKKLMWVSEIDGGQSDAINKGIDMATGDVVGILNSDDFFPDKSIVSKIVETFKSNDIDAVYGDIAFIRPDNLQKVIRHYSSKKFHPGKFAFGFMPAHPSFYAKKECYNRMGLYKYDYKIAADYELLIRFLFKNKIKTSYIPAIMVYMRTGGVSNKNVLSRYTLNKEIVRACKDNGINTNMFLLSLKYFKKIFEFINVSNANPENNK